MGGDGIVLVRQGWHGMTVAPITLVKIELERRLHGRFVIVECEPLSSPPNNALQRTFESVGILATPELPPLSNAAELGS